MTILDASGKEYSSERDAELWLLHAMYGWLQHEKVIRAMVEHYGPSYVQQMYTWAKHHVDDDKSPELWSLRSSAFSMLQQRPVRQQIAKAVHADQEADYERDMTQWVERTEAWLRTPPSVNPGPKPVRPDPPLTKEQTMEQLQAERVRLEELLVAHAAE
jgi:hypothetical protein